MTGGRSSPLSVLPCAACAGASEMYDKISICLVVVLISCPVWFPYRCRLVWPFVVLSPATGMHLSKHQRANLSVPQHGIQRFSHSFILHCFLFCFLSISPSGSSPLSISALLAANPQILAESFISGFFSFPFFFRTPPFFSHSLSETHTPSAHFPTRHTIHLSPQWHGARSGPCLLFTLLLAQPIFSGPVSDCLASASDCWQPPPPPWGKPLVGQLRPAALSLHSRKHYLYTRSGWTTISDIG
ncbi:hypothetical protein J3F84DRAFT_320091 [Trichoderma pleuroticola]